MNVFVILRCVWLFQSEPALPWPLNLAPLGFHQVLYFNVVSGERVTQDAVKDMRWNTWSCPMAWHTYLDEGDRLDHRDWCWRLNRGKGYFNDIQRWPWITRNWLIQLRLSLGTRNLERRGKALFSLKTAARADLSFVLLGFGNCHLLINSEDPFSLKSWKHHLSPKHPKINRSSWSSIGGLVAAFQEWVFGLPIGTLVLLASSPVEPLKLIQESSCWLQGISITVWSSTTSRVCPESKAGLPEFETAIHSFSTCQTKDWSLNHSDGFL